MSLFIAISTMIGITFLAATFASEMRSQKNNFIRKSDLAHDIMRNIVAQHSDCTAEVITLAVLGHKYASISYNLSIGDEIDLDITNSRINFCYKRRIIAHPTLPNSSRIIEAIERDLPIWAYLGGRDESCSNSNNDFISIIVFYKMPEIPPTKVNIQ